MPAPKSRGNEIGSSDVGGGRYIVRKWTAVEEASVYPNAAPACFDA